jgi:hypothetical protein
MACPDRRTSSLQSKATLADSRLKCPPMPEQTGLCLFTNHKGGRGNGRNIQRDTRTSTHLAAEGCNTLPAYCYAGKVTSETSSTSTVRHHHLHLDDVSVGCFDNQMMDLLVYHPISRPWQELTRSESGSAMNADVGSPLERWERETLRDQAWNGVAGIYGGPPAGSPDIVLVHEWNGPVKGFGSDKIQPRSLL